MPNFLSRIQALNTSAPPDVQLPLEARRVRRQKARNAAKTPRSVGAQAADATSDRSSSKKVNK